MRFTCLNICIFLCLSLQAAIIVTFSGDPIQDVTILAVNDHEITFVKNNSEYSVPYEQVEAIMYDDGRYVTLQHSTTRTIENEETTTPEDSIRNVEREKRRQDLKQAFDKAGSAMKGAFSTLFNIKKKNENNSSTDTSSSNAEPAPSNNAKEDNW